MDGMLDTSEAARRLGVKTPTLYAYVSRGLIQSHLGPDGRRSFFAVDDIERLARRSREGRSVETRLATIATSITQITELGPTYRGIPAVSLMSAGFEGAADLLMGAEPGAWEPFLLTPPSGLEMRDLIRCVVAMAGSLDPLRSDRRPEAVIRATRRLVATIVACLPPRSARSGGVGGTIAERLARRLSRDGRGTKWVDAIDATLVLLADNEIASSTLGVRLAASTRSDLYDAMLAGLGVLGGPLHGGNSELAIALLQRASELGAERAVDQQLRWHSNLPGFGVRVYPTGDPRFSALLPLLDGLLTEPQRDVLSSLLDLAAARDHPGANIDLALAALVWSMDADAAVGPAIFSIARVAGWASHYLEEINEQPLRFRARAVYVTPGDSTI